MPTPRDRRLQSDHEKVKKLVAESGGTLKLVRTAGIPPTTYIIEYHCPGLMKNQQGQVVAQDQHRVEISLGSSYPFEKPVARLLTPAFNPHIYTSGGICLGGEWSAAETLDALILRIGALLQLDPKVLNPRSPANSEANQWVQQNKSKIPLGQVSFKAGVAAPKRVQWSG